MIADFAEIEAFAAGVFNRAAFASQSIEFSQTELKANYGRRSGNLTEGALLIGNEPQFAILDNTFGMAAWSVILSVDLRRSSKRAVEIGAEHTYLTMHTYLTTMAELVKRANGKIVGLRGDGLFAAFGLTKLIGTGSEVTNHVAHTAIKCATRCGKAMLEATDGIINPLLARNEIRGDLAIGVGISVGNVVVTRIGLGDANEVTVYGPPVNQACKYCNKTNEIALTVGAWDIYPSAENGRIRFKSFEGGFTPLFPADYVMLKKNQEKRQTPRPR